MTARGTDDCRTQVEREMTCARPGPRRAEIVDALERGASVDATVARYAAADSERFAVSS